MKKNNSLAVFFAVLALLICNAGIALAAPTDSNIPSLKFVITKFGIAMGGVALFSLMLYLGLSLYNRFFVDAQIKDYNLRKDSLRSPKDKDEAIIGFITRSRLK